MLGIEDYGSDVESGDEPTLKTTETQPASTFVAPFETTPSHFKVISSSSSLSLPPSSSFTSGTSTASGTAAPKQKRTKKIAINLPSLPPTEADDDDSPPAKKPRITSNGGNAGAGMSSLLGMLPAPKQPVPVIEKKQERVLGGGGGPGLVFRTSKIDSEAQYHDTADEPYTETSHGGETDIGGDEPVDSFASSTSFLPPSLKKGRTNVSLENEGPSKRPPTQSQKSAAPPVDFFSLGTNTPPARSTPASLMSSASTATSAPSTSCTRVVLVFYLFRSCHFDLPSHLPLRWTIPTLVITSFPQAHTPPTTPNTTPPMLENGRQSMINIFAHSRNPNMIRRQTVLRTVDMAAEMEKARREIKEREDRKALTTGNAGKNEDGEPAMPRMNVKGAKLGSVARSRHQLTTLLTEAYLNREALEEQIAQGRRNRKEAGNKYGF
ncbi:mitotic checkpoint regulator, MAD2B-interacting-domain-containing protein [Chiua virens]|nr:mitotic checkpoint regulator, MAD2B-interacting-domain-containing protein [Chiua virens]